MRQLGNDCWLTCNVYVPQVHFRRVQLSDNRRRDLAVFMLFSCFTTDRGLCKETCKILQIDFKLRKFRSSLSLFLFLKKVESKILIQYTLCQIQRISPHSPLAFRSVCALKKQPGVHTQPWLCKREPNRAARVDPPTHVIKYQRISTKLRYSMSQLVHRTN